MSEPSKPKSRSRRCAHCGWRHDIELACHNLDCKAYGGHGLTAIRKFYGLDKDGHPIK